MKRLSHSEAVRRLGEVHKNLDLRDFTYVGSTTTCEFVCNFHGAFKSKYGRLVQGHGCPECWKQRRGLASRTPKEVALERLASKWPSYCFDGFEYCGTTAKSLVVCPKHGDFQSNYDTLIGGHGCPSCGVERRSDKARKSQGEVIYTLSNLFPNFDFSKFVYGNNKSLGVVVCREHGEFLASYGSLQRGRGCPRCGIESRAECNRGSFSEFISRAMETHGDKYTYNEASYTKLSGLVSIMCPVHGEFRQRGFDHLYGRGCRACASSGFNPLLPGYVYVYVIHCIDKSYVGYGITNKLAKRKADHQSTFKRNEVEGDIVATFRFSRGSDCKRIEEGLTKSFPVTSTGLSGFIREATHFSNLEAVISYIICNRK